MPPKRKIRRKKKNMRRLARRNRLSIARPLRPAVYNFKRTISTIVTLGQDQGWQNNDTGGIANTFAFKLSDLNQHSDFFNLFKYYKIAGVRTQLYFSNTNSERGAVTQSQNNQLMIWYDTNKDGNVANAPTETHFLNSQTAQKRVALTTDRKPIDIFQRVMISNEVYRSPLATSYTLMRPKWLNTSVDDVPHYGLDMSISRVSKQNLSQGQTNYQYMNIISTYYIQCKKVE